MNRQRLFHFEGNLGGLSYEGRLRIFELSTRDGLVDDAPERLAGADRPIVYELQVWESEGGASSSQLNSHLWARPSGPSQAP